MENLGGVVLVKDINLGISNYGYYNNSRPTELTEFNGKLYFSADDGENGRELWVSNGTTEGTNLVADINSGANASYPSNFIEIDGKLYFSATTEENGRELWISDGTTEGTRLVTDINPNVSGNGFAYGSDPDNFIEFNNKLYFTADDGENGEELWVSDGTSEGTNLVADLRPGTSDYGGYGLSSYPQNLTEVDDKLYFSAFGENGENNLWQSDGTSEGTNLVAELNSGNIFFSYPSDFIEFNDKLYFSAPDDEKGKELWVSDGTTEGTQIVADIRSGEDGSYPSDFIEFNDKLYFSAFTDEEGRELWVSDGLPSNGGTSEGTQLVADIRPGIGSDGLGNGSDPTNFIEFNDKLYFTVFGDNLEDELWVSDGTAEGTQLVAEISSMSSSPSSEPGNFIEFNNKLYFSTPDDENGNELWVSDGTTEGTQLVADINPGLDSYGRGNSSYPDDLTVFNNELFFGADNSETGRELFKLTLDRSPEPEQPSVNIIDGTNGKDNLVGTDGADQIEGLNGKDTLDGGAENDTLLGGKGKDSLVGGAGNDSLIGGNGKDILNGGVGRDILTGGEGKDTFVIASGNGEDIITDFELGVDRLSLIELEFRDLSFAENAIYAGDEVLAILAEIDTENLTAKDFESI